MWPIIMSWKSGDVNNLLQIRVAAVAFISHFFPSGTVPPGHFYPQMYLFSLLISSALPPRSFTSVSGGRWQWHLRGAQTLLLRVGCPVLVRRVYSLPFHPPGARFSPALAVVQLFCSVTGNTVAAQGVSLNLIYCQLTQTFNYWFGYWGEKRNYILLNKHSGKHRSSPFLRLNFRHLSSLLPHLNSPCFHRGSPLSLLPPSQSLQWGDGQRRRLGSRHGGFCLLPLVDHILSSTAPCSSLLFCLVWVTHSLQRSVCSWWLTS